MIRPRYRDTKGSATATPTRPQASKPQTQPPRAPEVSGDTSSQWRTISRRDAADFLTNPRTATLIQPFMGAPSTIKRAAERLHISPLRMFRAVKKMEELQLLEVACVETRRGRPLKHYRASSDAYFIPYRVTGADNLEDFLMAQDERLRRVFVRSFAEYLLEVLHEQGSDPGRVIVRKPDGNVVTHSVGGLDDPRGTERPILEDDAYLGWSNYSLAKLDLASAQALKRELVQLFEKYSANSGERGFIVRLGMAPLRESLMDLLER
jgi:hypothetical protein